jgi:uncharacterized phage-associated protein
VVDVVYQEYKRFGYQGLPGISAEAPVQPEERVVLEDVLAVYGEHSAKFLEALTHGEKPWVTVGETDRPPAGAGARFRSR